MPRVLGVDIPNGKPTYISLTYLRGIGVRSAISICQQLEIDPHTKSHQLTEDQVSSIAKHIDNNYMVEGALKRDTEKNITRLKDIKSYRGLRHRHKLPVRGQNTQTNARTRKGAKKTVANKKGVKDARH